MKYTNQKTSFTLLAKQQGSLALGSPGLVPLRWTLVGLLSSQKNLFRNFQSQLKTYFLVYLVQVGPIAERSKSSDRGWGDLGSNPGGGRFFLLSFGMVN